MNFRAVFTDHVPLVIYCVIGLGFLVQGLRYLGATELMPYHMDVIQTPWVELTMAQQQLFLGLLKGFGAGSLATGVAVILLALIPLRSRQPWAYVVTPAVSAIYVAALVYVTRWALLPGAVPIAVSKVFLGLLLLAWVLSIFRVKVPH